MKNFLHKACLTMLLFVVGVCSGWADKVGTIKFGTNDVKINAASVTGEDDLGNTWTITTAGTTSFTTNAAYYQVGSSKSPATSITFTTTLPASATIKEMSAKFGGFTDTRGSIALKVGDTSIGTGSLNAASDVTIKSNSSAAGTVLTVTVTGIAKGVKCYNISYTIVDQTSTDPVDASWTIDSSVSLKEGRTKNLTLETNYDGELIAASENDEIATASYDDETNVLTITGVKAGSTRIGFLGDATSAFNAIEEYVEVTVLAPGVITVGTTNVGLNNELFGTHYTSTATNCKANELDLIGEESGIAVEIKNGESTAMYITDEQLRIYNGYTMNVSVPNGYVITGISFNEPSSSKKWDANPTPSVGEFVTDTKNWTGSAQEITFTLTAQCRMVSMDVTVAKATTSVPLSISSVGYATYYNEFAYVMPEGLEGKIMEDENGIVKSTLVFSAGDVVPAETALLIKGSEGVYPLLYTDANPDADNAEYCEAFNLLRGSLEDAETTGGNVYYKLANGGNGLGWYWGAEGGAAFTNPAHKAYIALGAAVGSSESARFIAIDFGKPTAIESVEMDTTSEVYDLAGRRVKNASNGLYIVNGKKVIR